MELKSDAETSFKSGWESLCNFAASRKLNILCVKKKGVLHNLAEDHSKVLVTKRQKEAPEYRMRALGRSGSKVWDIWYNFPPSHPIKTRF